MAIASTRRRPRRLISSLTLWLLPCGLVAAAFWLGLIPQRISPFAAVDLSEPAPWFLDFRLAALRQDAALCASILKAPEITANTVIDRPYREGCGWKNAVHITSAGGARVSVGTVTCESAAAFAMWLTHDVQAASVAIFGVRVASIQSIGGYACRNIVGNKMWSSFRSQHATANAMDLSGFTLTDGRTISVRRHWTGDTPESRFLHHVHDSACRYFRVALGPDYNTAHHDHIHLDRGYMRSCK